MDEARIYNILLSGYLLTDAQMKQHGFALKDPIHPDRMLAPMDPYGDQKTLSATSSGTHECFKCKKMFRVGDDGFPVEGSGPCINHLESVQARFGHRHACCKGARGSFGCTAYKNHVHRGEQNLYNYTGFVETKEKPWLLPHRHGVYALDCEFVYTVCGLELARVSVVDHNSALVYDKLVKPPNRIVECQPKMTGITEEMLNEPGRALTLQQVQDDLLNLFSSETILIGHSVNWDMKALKMFHSRFVDTSVLYPSSRGFPIKRGLAELMNTLFRIDIKLRYHDSIEDARAALKLVLHKI